MADENPGTNDVEDIETDHGAEARYPGVGFRLGEYTITDTLGQGAMATVFQARDRTGHDVALKVFQEGPGVSKTMLERFRREAEASKKLRRHPNILTIYGTGKEGPYHYIIMESVKGSRTLEDALESTPISLSETVKLIIKIARALQYAHTRNIIHRDVKPSNIMVDEFGEPLLSDFGVAELIDWPSCTVTGALTGTPLYMSPEQARAERVGAASDIYSLGVVLFEATTGVLPYSTQHAAPIKDVLQAVKEELPKRPRLYRKDISADLEAVMFKALEKNARDRYVDSEAFAFDLERALSGRPVSAHHFTFMDRTRHFARQNERLLSTLLMVGLATSGVGIFFKNRLRAAHYDNLVSIAWRTNARYMLSNQGDDGTTSGIMPRAWQEIRLARRAMNGRDWATSLQRLESATELSISVGDARTAAMAQLDAARSAMMLSKRDKAGEFYLAILKNPDAPPALATLAQLEYVTLSLLNGDREQAVETLLMRELPPEGPIRDALTCLAGNASVKDVLSDIATAPHRFRNDAYLAAALHYYFAGDRQKAAEYFKRCVTSSMPSTEWPAPLAQKLNNELL